MFFLTVGIWEGSAKGFNYGHAIAYNLIPVTIGNIIGGSLCVAFAEWAAYGHHFGEVAKQLDTLPDKHRAAAAAGAGSSGADTGATDNSNNSTNKDYDQSNNNGKSPSSEILMCEIPFNAS